MQGQEGVGNGISRLEEVCWSDTKDGASVHQTLSSDGASGNMITRTVFKPQSGDVLSTIGKLGTERGVVYLKVSRSDEDTNNAGDVLEKWWVELAFDNTPVECSAGHSFVFPADCEPCPAGTYIVAGMTACKECAEGKFSPTQAAADPSACKQCSAGKYAVTTGNDKESDCVACGAGTYSLVAGAASETTCLDCIAGKYSAQGAATACVNCPAGTYAYLTSTGASDDSVCFECPAGKYSETPGAKGSVACAMCPDGSTSSPGSGSKNSCQTCPATLFLARDFPADECYIPESAEWRGECAPCPANSKRSNGHRIQDCLCQPGYEKVLDQSSDTGIFTCAVQNLCAVPKPCNRNTKKDSTLTCVPGSSSPPGTPSCVCDPRRGYMPKKLGKEKERGCTGLSRPLDGCRVDFDEGAAAGSQTDITFTFKLYADLHEGEHVDFILPDFTADSFQDVHVSASFTNDLTFLSDPIPGSKLPAPVTWAPVERPRWVQLGSSHIFDDIWRTQSSAAGCFNDTERSKTKLLAARTSPDLSMGKLRCGAHFDGARCDQEEAPFCNEDSGWCGITDAHKHAQASTDYDWTPCLDPPTHKAADRIVRTVDECAAVASSRSAHGFCIAQHSECFVATDAVVDRDFDILGEPQPCDPTNNGLGADEKIQCYKILSPEAEFRAWMAKSGQEVLVGAWSNAKSRKNKERFILTAKTTIPMGTEITVTTKHSSSDAARRLRLPAQGLAADSPRIMIVSSGDKRRVKQVFKAAKICTNPKIDKPAPETRTIAATEAIEIKLAVGDIRIPSGSLPEATEVVYGAEPFDAAATPITEDMTVAGPVTSFLVNFPEGEKAKEAVPISLKASAGSLELYEELKEDAQIRRSGAAHDRSLLQETATQDDEDEWEDPRSIVSAQLLQHWYNNIDKQWVAIPGGVVNAELGMVEGSLPPEVLNHGGYSGKLANLLVTTVECEPGTKHALRLRLRFRSRGDC